MTEEQQPDIKPDIKIDERPSVKPTEDVWKICVALGEEREMTPFSVLSKFVEFAAKVAVAEKAGDPAYAKDGDRFVELSVLGKREKTS